MARHEAKNRKVIFSTVRWPQRDWRLQLFTWHKTTFKDVSKTSTLRKTNSIGSQQTQNLHCRNGECPSACQNPDKPHSLFGLLQHSGLSSTQLGAVADLFFLLLLSNLHSLHDHLHQNVLLPSNPLAAPRLPARTFVSWKHCKHCASLLAPSGKISSKKAPALQTIEVDQMPALFRAELQDLWQAVQSLRAAFIEGFWPFMQRGLLLLSGESE